MDNFAVVRVFGQQHLVAPGDVIKVNAQVEPNEEPSKFFDVLLYADKDVVRIGDPTLNNVKVKASVLKTYKGEKIRVEKFKAKSRYHRVKGFRPQVSEIKIEGLAVVNKTVKK